MTQPRAVPEHEGGRAAHRRVTRGSDGAQAPAARTPPHDLLRALAGSAIALIGVVLGIGALLLLRGHSAPPPGAGPVIELPASQLGARSSSRQPAAETSSTPTPAASSSPPVTPPLVAPTTAHPASTPVTVLNDSTIPGLASRAAADLTAAGWSVRTVGNFTGRVRVTTAYYPPGGQASARALANRFPAVRRVLPRFAGLPGSGLTLVVTREYAVSGQ